MDSIKNLFETEIIMTPVEAGYKMPPEWDKHERTFMEWPVKEAMWPGDLTEIHNSYAKIVKAISEFEPVSLIVRPDLLLEAKSYCGDFAEFIQIEHDDSWMRDNGPTFVIDSNGNIAGINWIFTGWGGKFPAEKDNEVASKLLKILDIKAFDLPLVMEGGSFHTDGEGTLLTTRECLLNDNRNPDMTQEQIEEVLMNCLGVNKIIWLNKGLFGDDTDGHIDNSACFARPGEIIMLSCSDKNDPNYEIFMENYEILKNSTDAKGRSFEISLIEQPVPVLFDDVRQTYSYLNFYFVNDGIILPIFGGESSDRDEMAVKELEKIFPDRKIRTIEGCVVARGGGNVHCLTQQMPLYKNTRI